MDHLLRVAAEPESWLDISATVVGEPASAPAAATISPLPAAALDQVQALRGAGGASPQDSISIIPTSPRFPGQRERGHCPHHGPDRLGRR